MKIEYQNGHSLLHIFSEFSDSDYSLTDFISQIFSLYSSSYIFYVYCIFSFSSGRNSPGAYSLDASGALGLSEKTFLNPKKLPSTNDVETENFPSLDDFDKEIEIFRVSI